MIRRKRRSFLLMSCIFICIPFMMAGQSLAQCTMTTASLEAVLTLCVGDDLDCFAGIAHNFPSCAGNVAWYYMLLYTPDDPNAVLNRFMSGLPDEFSGELAAAVKEANRVNQEQQDAGSQTSANEYPFGQGAPYGQ